MPPSPSVLSNNLETVHPVLCRDNVVEIGVSWEVAVLYFHMAVYTWRLFSGIQEIHHGNHHGNRQHVWVCENTLYLNVTANRMCHMSITSPISTFGFHKIQTQKSSQHCCHNRICVSFVFDWQQWHTTYLTKLWFQELPNPSKNGPNLA